MPAERVGFWRRTWRSKSSPRRASAPKPDPADMGTAFGLDASLDSTTVTNKTESQSTYGEPDTLESSWARARLNGRSVK